VPSLIISHLIISTLAFVSQAKTAEGIREDKATPEPSSHRPSYAEQFSNLESRATMSAVPTFKNKEVRNHISTIISIIVIFMMIITMANMTVMTVTTAPSWLSPFPHPRSLGVA
jgi:hypothetical protein